MIAAEGVQIEFSNVNDASADVSECLKNLYTTPKGTVPFDRDFGLDWSVLDLPLNIAKGRYSLEVIEATRKYEWRVLVEEVRFENSLKVALEGKLIPKVVLRYVGAL